MKIINIIGLSHSRATILGYYLITDEKTLFIGEPFNTKSNNYENTHKYCSCKKKYESCDFWKYITGNNNFERAKSIIKMSKYLGYNKIIVSDGLKSEYVFKNLGYDTSKYFVIKNPFSWISSIKKKN